MLWYAVVWYGIAWHGKYAVVWYCMALRGIAWYGVVLWCDVLLTAQVPLALQASAAVTGDGAGTPRVDFCHNKQDRGKMETSETSQQTGQGKDGNV